MRCKACDRAVEDSAIFTMQNGEENDLCRVCLYEVFSLFRNDAEPTFSAYEEDINEIINEEVL